MAKKIAFVFTHSPHGTASGREGLDAVLATSAINEDISLYFISDGVYQLLSGQQPDLILSRNYIATFKLLPLYEITNCYICSDSLIERNLSDCQDWIVDVKRLSGKTIAQQIAQHDVVLTF